MRTQSPDTSPEAERILIELLRATPPWRRLHLAQQLSASVRQLAVSGLKARHPAANGPEFRRLKMKFLLGEILSDSPELEKCLTRCT